MDKLAELIPLYKHWNEQINVVSRNDIANLYERHIQHSLAIAKFIAFVPGSQVLDLGTGGGFPGIPLAIQFPLVNFTLIDSIGKKIKVVNGVAEALELNNITAIQGRAEELKQQFDFVVTRAVAPLSELERWTKGKFRKKGINAIPNGIIALKGGDLTDELKPFKKLVEVVELSQWFDTEFFQSKKLVYLPM